MATCPGPLGPIGRAALVDVAVAAAQRTLARAAAWRILMRRSSCR